MLQVFSGQHPLTCWSPPVSLRVFVSRREIIPACQVWALKESMSSHCCVLGINGKTTSEGALAWWLWCSAVFSWAGGDSSRKKWAQHTHSCPLSPHFQTTSWIVRHLTWHCSLLLWCKFLNLTWNVKWDALFFSFHSNSLLIWMLTFLVCQAECPLQTPTCRDTAQSDCSGASFLGFWLLCRADLLTSPESAEVLYPELPKTYSQHAWGITENNTAHS